MFRKYMIRNALFGFGLMAVAGGRQASAQQTTVAVHGLGQNGSSWLAHQQDLEDSTYISLFRPTVGQGQPYDVQASTLASLLGGFSNIPAISHSNGGVVVREYIRSGGTKIDKHLSLGTPHYGAPIAATWEAAFAYYASVFGLIIYDINWFSNNDPNFDFGWFGGASGFTIESYALELGNFFTGPGLPLSLFVLLAIFNDPIIQSQGWTPELIDQMSPTSTFFTTLNAALGGEAAQMPSARVGISTQYPPELMPWRVRENPVATPQQNNTIALYYEILRQDLMWFAMEAYWYYLGHWDWNLSSNAWRWEDIFYALAYVPGDWQLFIGAPVYGESDGIVPWASSRYPNGTNNLFTYSSEDWIFHNDQLRDSPENHFLKLRMYSAIRNDFGLSNPPPPPPPPPALNVNIGGPSTVPLFGWCTWNASVSGGTPPYTSYEWSGILTAPGHRYRAVQVGLGT
jgi:hypothetical protein